VLLIIASFSDLFAAIEDGGGLGRPSARSRLSG